MTLPRLADLLEYYEANPPAHVLLKAFVGWGQKTGDSEAQASKTRDEVADAADFVSHFASTGGAVHSAPIPEQYMRVHEEMKQRGNGNG